jgi:hypothetical protein
MSEDGARQCETGSGCMYEDEEHLEPILYWIGDAPLAHGERDDEDPEHPEHCLCGHPNYLTCPGEGLWTMTVGDPYGGRL